MQHLDRSQHEAEECERREVKCRLGCGETMQQLNRNKHEAELCLRRGVKCRLGCGEKIQRVNRSQHEAELCELREVKCRYGCGEITQRVNRNQHEVKDCKLAFFVRKTATQRAKENRHRLNFIDCVNCGVTRPRADFSKRQASHRTTARCAECIATTS